MIRKKNEKDDDSKGNEADRQKEDEEDKMGGGPSLIYSLESSSEVIQLPGVSYRLFQIIQVLLMYKLQHKWSKIQMIFIFIITGQSPSS